MISFHFYGLLQIEITVSSFSVNIILGYLKGFQNKMDILRIFTFCSLPHYINHSIQTGFMTFSFQTRPKLTLCKINAILITESRKPNPVDRIMLAV